MKLLLPGICTMALLALPPVADASSPSPISSPGAAAASIDVDLMELVSVDYEPGKKLPKRIRDLDGETVRIEGYMSIDTQEGVDEFLLTFDSCGCSATKVHHFVAVTLTDDLTRYTPGKIEVEGEFSVGEKMDEYGFVESIYRLETESYES